MSFTMSVIGSNEVFEGVNGSEEYTKDDAFQIGAATPDKTQVDSKPSEAISKQKEEKKPKTPKPRKKGVTTKPKEGKATPRNENDPQNFIRRIVYKESDGKTILGSVHFYDGKRESFFVVYEDGEEKYVPQNEIFNKVATAKEVSQARSQLTKSGSSKKNDGGKKKRSAAGEGSAPTKKKGNTSEKK